MLLETTIAGFDLKSCITYVTGKNCLSSCMRAMVREEIDNESKTEILRENSRSMIMF